MTASAIYLGVVRHRRCAHPAREFSHRVAYLYLDLDELPQLLDGLLVRRRPGVVRVRRRDLIGEAGDLRDGVRDAVRSVVTADTGSPPPAGAVRVLTQPRVFGVCFNPISLYYVFDVDEQLGMVVAEVTNTPWLERHAYVVRRASNTDRASLAQTLRGTHPKALHVSPFQPMARRHELVASLPGETLAVRVENHRPGAEPDFTATLALRREPLTDVVLRRILLRQPGGALRTLALIYGHALALRLRGAERFAHPAATMEERTR